MLTQSQDTLIALNDYIARPAAMDDIPALVEMLNACAIEEFGAPDETEDSLRSGLEAPGFSPAADTLAVFLPDGRAVGYVEYWNNREPRVRPYLYGRVHPAFTSLGIGTYLTRWGEQRAAQDIPLAPENARVAVFTGTNALNRRAIALFESEGYTHSRTYYRMLIEMDAPPPAPVWPEGITVRPATTDRADLRAIHAAIEESFQDHWGYLPMTFENWIHWTDHDPDFDPSLWFIAMDGGEIAAISLCRPFLTGTPDTGWVNTLGVRRPWRRQGLGLALLHHSFGVFWQRGTRNVGLGVDASSLTGATRLYERAGMHVWREHYNFAKELRPGEELSTQTVEE